jgi:hypothetical protein
LIVIIIKYHTQKNAQTKVIKPAKVVIKCQNSESMLHVNCRMVLYLKRSWLWCTLVILVGTTWNALELIIRYRPHSAVLISRLKNTVGWFAVREKYCSGWKNKLKKTDYKPDEQGHIHWCAKNLNPIRKLTVHMLCFSLHKN